MRGYPTLLFVDAKGEELDRIVGFQPPKTFLASVKAITGGNTFAALKKKAAANPDDFEIARLFSQKLEERNDLSGWKRIAGSEKAPVGLREEAEGKLVAAAYYESRGKEAAPAVAYFEKHKAKRDVTSIARLLFGHYQQAKDTEKVVAVGDYLIEKGSGSDAEFLNNYAWYLALEKKRLDRAFELAKKAVELSPKSAHILDTLAEVHLQSGRAQEAVATQKRAVELATKEQKAELEKRLHEFEKALGEKKEGAKE